jgi:inhibitor of KinA
MTALLKKNLPAGVEAVVPAYRSLSILYDPLVTTPAGLAEIIHALEANSRVAEIALPKVVPIPVCYGGGFGPDMGVVAEYPT